jgi:hypothetical protein
MADLLPVRRRMDRRQTYTPVNCCIYCGRREPGVKLHREHIIAESLGGMLELPASSCDDCGRETHAFEGLCAGRMYGPIRAQLNFPSKRSLKNRVKKFTMTFDGVRRKVHQDEYPGILITFVRTLPGILIGEPATADFAGAVAITTLPEFGDRLNKLRAKYKANKVEFNPEYGIESLGRLLAKTAYAYAVAEMGYGSFRPLVIDLILNYEPKYLAYYVGGTHEKEAPLGGDLHEIEIDNTGLGKGQYIVVRIQLFADRRLPVYYVVVGEVIDTHQDKVPTTA